MLTNNGQIAAANDVILVGSSTLTLAGGLGLNNTLRSITFNNNGGSGTPTLSIPTNSILTLTSSAPVTVLNSNAATVPTISGGFLALGSGANTFSIQGPTLAGQLYTQIGAALSVSSVITGAGTSITKTDTGLLQLSGQNTFDGGMAVQGGGIILSASSTSTLPSGGLVSGPLGTGAVSFANGTSLLADNNSRTVANAMSFAGNPIFNNTGTTLVTLTLNGALNFATQTTTGVVVNIPTPYLNVVLGGPIANIGTITSIGGTGANTISKTGLGNITGLDFTGIGSSVPINIGALSNGAFSILHDGDATGSLQTINLGAITWEPAVTGTALVLTIGRAGTALYYPLAVNKTLAPSALISSQLGNGINLTNNNNYGLLLADNITFNTVSANQGPTFTVATASTSLQPDGLTLSGVLSGGPTGASAVVLTKAGAGVLTLTNAGNTFGGGGSIIDITAGQLAASNDGALGNSGNIIRLSGNNLGYGFRATGTFASSHTFNLNSAAGEIEVTQGNTLTLNNAFTFASANNAFRKYDIGTLVLTQPETGWNGVMFIQQGVLRISDGAQLGNASSLTTATATTGASGQSVLTPTGGTATYGVGQTVFGTGIPADTTITAITATTITLSANTTAANPTITTSAGGIVLANVGAALELTGGVTVADGVLVNASNNATSAGINEGGAIRSSAGTNTISGVITIATTTTDNQMRAATLAADAGATLNITGGVVGQVGTAGTNRHSWVGLGGAGTINITTTGFTNTGTLGIYQLNKFGTGTLNIQVANAFSGRDVIVKQGTLSMNGAGTFGGLGSGQGALRTVYVHDFATLTLDNSGVIGNNVNNRLGNAALNFQGSDFRLIGNDNTTTTETTTGTMTINAGALVFTLDAGAGQQLNFTTAAVTRNAGSTLLIRADGFGNAAGANVATIQGSTATYAFTGELGGTGSTSKSILPWAFGNNTSLSGDALGFVTADSSAAGANAGTNRLRLLSASEQVTGITAPVTLNAFENLNVTTAISGTSTFNILNPWQVNSLQLSSGGSLSVDNHLRAFTIESGGLLALAGSSGISGNGYLTTTSNRELIIYNIADLNIGIAIAGTTSGLTKSGSGVLTLTAGNAFTGTVTVNDGTLKLGGGDQTILPNQALQLNAGNLDLNGTVQNFNSLFAQTGSVAVNDGFAVNTGGNVINTSASQATLGITTSNVSFRGAIGNGNVGQSNIAVVRSQSAGATQDWNLYSDNTYTGATLLNGGRTQLIDGGKLSGTSSIEISNSTLSVSASNISTEPVSLTDRINDAASITLNGAMFQWRSRAALYSTEQLGVVKLGYGSSIIDFSEPGTSVNQSDITFASFAQVAGQHGTVRFLNIDGNISALQRLFISNLNGVATTNIGDGLTNNIIGGWATFEREFATYTPGEGVAGLTNNGYAGYSPNTIFNGTATDNIRILLPVAGSTTTLTADTTLYTLNLQANTGATGSSVLDLGGKTLTLASGGLILSPISTAASANSINLINGSLTAGTTSSPADLYLHALSWLNNQADNTGNADVTVSANIINNVAGGAVTLVIDANNGRGSLAATNDVFITGSNTYTGGTFVNSGRVVLNTAGANGTTLTAIGTGDLTIAGGYSSNPGIFSDRNTRVVLGAGSQIKNTATVTIMGGATLDLNGFNQTVGGIVFNNNGGDTPTITTGTNGNLILGGNVHASGQNLGSVSTISTAGTGTINLGGSTRTFTVDPVQWNGENLNYLLPNLNVTGVVVSTAGEGIIKNGTGLLQLSGQSTFSGGVNLVAGGLAIGASTNVTARDAVTGVASAFASGPLGTGVLTIGAGTFLTSSSSANIINNDYVIGGDFSLKGNLNLTLNGATTLASGSTTITVDTILTNLTLNGIISGTDNTSAIIKAGQGTLTLGNNNTFQGGITLNGGNLVMAGLNGGFASPIPGGAALINSSSALLSLLNNGGGSGTVITYANDITLAGAISGAGLNIGNNGANTNNIVEVANLNIASGQTLDVSSANGFQLRLLNVNTTGATAARLNPSLGTIIYVFNYGSLKPVNVGLGTVIFPELPVINTTTPLANGSTITGLNPVVPQAATLSSLPGDYNGGGLSASYYQFATSAAISSAIASGAGASGTFGQVGLGDMGGLNHPTGVTSTNFNGGISVQSGYLQIVSGGNYTFRTAADDSSILYIDGRAIISNATGGAAESAGGTTVFLSAGYHSIVFKQENASGTTNAGGFHVLYSGPDTVSDQGANTTPGNFQAIPTSRLFAASTNLATAGNNYLTAAQLTGGWNLAGSDRASVDTLGSVLNSSIDTLSIGNGTTAAPTILSIVSGTGGSIGTGWFGVTGTTTVGSNAILNVGLNPTSAAGMLYLIGGVSDSGNGFVKTGSGSLIMGSSASFTGALTVQAGTLVVAGSNALTTGTTTIAGGNATVTSGITTGLTTVTMASTAGRSVGELVIGTGIPQGAFITRIVNGTTVEISDAATATNAALAAVFATGATLDLNGITGITGNIVLNGTGQVNPTTGTATSLITAGGATITAGMLGGANAALWNSSANAASVAGNITINTNNVQIGGQGDISLDGTITSSASNPLTKISGNTLTLTADNSATLLGAIAVNSGTLKVGNVNALGATSSATTVASGAVLDLNGFSISEPLTISGTGLVNLGLSVNSLGALINSSTTTSVLSGSLTLAANASIGSSGFNGLSGVTEGSIQIDGLISGNFTLTKVGTASLIITNSGNTYDGTTINQGTIIVRGSGRLGDAGTITISGSGFSSGVLASQLILDNTSIASSTRLGGLPLSLTGGLLEIDGNSTTAVNETLASNQSISINNMYNMITLVNNGANVRITTAGTGTLTRVSNGALLIRGTNLGSAAPGATNTNLILATAPTFTGQAATSGKNMRVLSWVIADPSATGNGTGANATFATWDATNGIRPLNLTTEMDTTFTANNNIRLTSALNSGADATVFSNTTVNSLTFESGGSLTINALRNVTVDSGGILAKASGIISGTGSITATTANNLSIFTMGSGTLLEIDVSVGGLYGAPSTAGLSKSGEGTLMLNAQNNYIGETRLNLGTLQLGSSAPLSNAIFYRFTEAPAPNATAVTLRADNFVSQEGSIFDLNGHNQAVGSLASTLTQPGGGGIITNQAAGFVNFQTVMTGSFTFAGSINDNLNFIRSGGSTLTLTDNSNYSGTTLLMGGLTTLQDQGRISGGGTITINRSVLRWDDSGIQALSDRLSTSTSVSNASSSSVILNGGALYYISRAGTNGVATFGDLTLASNASFVQAGIGNGNVGTAAMSFGSLIRQGTASVTFSTANGGLGDNPFITFSTAPTLTNGIIGAWATVITTTPSSGAAFATYDPATGVRPLASYMQTSSFAASTATDNLLLRSSTVVTSGGATVNTLTWNGLAAAQTLTFVNANDVLTLTAGGMIGGTENFGKTIGTTALPGVITTGASQLYIHNAENVLQINSRITGNFDLVLTGMGRADLAPEITLGNANTYVGTTYANGVILNLSNATGSGNAVTGNLVISGGTSTVTDSAPITASRVINRGFSDQIVDTATVTINGGGMWALNGYNETVASLVFTSDGGSNANEGARVETGTGLLTLTGNITANNLQQLGVIPLLTGNVNMAGSHTITVDAVAGSMVSGNSQIGLALETNFVGGTTNLQKLGVGVLALAGQGNATTNINVDVQTGTIVLTSTTAYSRLAISLAAGTTLDMRGQSNLALGSVTGSGTIRNFNPAAGGTLTLGLDNASTTFDGNFMSDFTAGLLNVTKAGSGSWTLTADNSGQLIGNLAVNGGSVILSGATAKSGFINVLVDEGGTLTLDNSTNALNNRLGGTQSIASNTRLLSMRGGVFNYIGSNGTGVSESLGTVTFLEGQSQWNLTSSSNSTVINIATLSASSTTNRGTGGINAGSAILGGTAGSGSVNVVAAAANLVGGGGAAGTKTMSIRPDLIGIDSTNPTGGLITSVAGTGLRLLTASEYQLLPGSTSGLGAVVSGITSTGNGVVQFADTTGLVVGESLVAAVNGITASSLITAVGANSVTFGSNATSSAAGRFNLSVLATVNALATSSTQMYQSVTLNSLTLGSGGGLTSNGNLMTAANGALGLKYGIAGTLNTLTLTSGAIVANTGNTGINNGAISAAANLLILHTLGDLTITSAILGSGGIVKADGGMLTLSGYSYNTGATFVNDGTLKLNAGANTLLVLSTATIATVADLVVNSGTFDLNGYNQAVRQITVTNNNLLPNSGGSIVNTSATTATLFTAQSTSASFAGVLGGTGGNNFNVDKTGNATWTLTSAATYTGSTTVRAGTLSLQDGASIQNTSAIYVNYATLTWNDTGISSVLNRFGSAPITLTGGTIAITPRQEGEINNTFGSITLNAGMNIINFATPERGGGFNITSSVLNQLNSAMLYIVNGTYTIGRSPLSVEGGQGPTIVFNTAPALINNIIGGWAIYQGTDFLTYLPTQVAGGGLGVGVLGDTGPGFANYNTNSTVTATTTLGGAGAANNVKYITTTNNINFVIAAAYIANSLVLNSTQANTPLTWTNATDLLTLTSGGFLKTGNASISIGATVDSGRITTGTASQTLYLYNNQSTLTLNARVVDNGSPVTLVLATANGGAFALANPNQTYTGGTIIDSATTSITATTAGIVIPTGGLTLNNAALNFTGGSTTLFGLIDASNVITLNGGASLTFPNYTVTGSNTFNSIVFNNMGGTATPTFNLGTPAAGSINKVILTAANAITVVNDNLGTTPTISGTYTSATQFASLEFSNASPVINVSGLSPMGLIISAAITQNAGMTGAISKTGSGSLVLNNANSNWTTGFNLNGGTLILDAASAGTPPTITNGPLGTGALTIADGTTIQAGTAARVIGNLVTINGNFTFGGQANTQNLTFSGTVNLGTASRIITVSSPQVTATISGKLTSGAGSGLTKAGDGTLVLSGTGNDYTGATIVSGGLLKYGSTNAIPVLSAVSVFVGGTLDLNGGGAAITFASLSGSSSTTGGLITTSATSGTVTLTIGDSTSTAFGGAITNNVGSTLNLVKVGTGTLTLGGPNSYSGSTTINSGGITTAANNVLPDTSAVTLAATTASATVTLDLNGNNDGIASLTYAGAAGSIGVVQTGAGTLTLFGNVTYDATSNPGAASLSGNVNLGGATRTFTIGDSTATTQELTVSATISGTTVTDGVTKAGAGTMVFSGANTYTGKTAVNAGTLSISADNNLGAVPGSAVADQLTLNGGTLQTTADMTIADSRGITVGASGGTFETVTGTTATVNSVVTGGGVINKTGGGTLLFTAANTNTAATNVNAGTLGGTGTVGGDLNVNTGGTVAPGITAAGLLTIGGNLTVNSGGTLLMQVGGATLNDADSIRGNQGSLTSLAPSIIAGWENANTLSLHDRIFSNDVSAPVINGTFKIDPAFLNGYTATYGDVFDFLDWSNLSNSITGTTTFDFSGVVLGSGLAFNTDLFASNGIIVIVPEPGRAFLLLFGLLGFFLRRRRGALV